MLATQLPAFYTDLRDPLFETALAIFHQRYSTNTMPNWPWRSRSASWPTTARSTPPGRNWMRAREAELTSPVWGDARELRPIIWEEGSDPASLDNALELLEESGRDVLHSMMMLVPPAWENMAEMEPRLRDFYRYHDTVVEPWDGRPGLHRRHDRRRRARPERPAPLALQDRPGRAGGGRLRGRRRRHGRRHHRREGRSVPARCSPSTRCGTASCITTT